MKDYNYIVKDYNYIVFFQLTERKAVSPESNPESSPESRFCKGPTSYYFCCTDHLISSNMH